RSCDGAVDRNQLERRPASNRPAPPRLVTGVCSGDPMDGDAFRHVPCSDGRGWIMDDVPAGPASPEPRRPSLSVVVPVRNGGHGFERCLRRLRDSALTEVELIVVDDGSTDGSAAVARQAGAVVVQNAVPMGPAAARNRGAQTATSSLIFFVDADVAVHRETLSRAVARFEADPGLSALFGS